LNPKYNGFCQVIPPSAAHPLWRVLIGTGFKEENSETDVQLTESGKVFPIKDYFKNHHSRIYLFCRSCPLSMDTHLSKEA
jgi:hypothetical protein